MPTTPDERSGAFFRMVEECSTGMLVQCDGRIVYANRAALDCLGFAAEAELLGLAVEEILGSESFATLSPNLRKSGPHDDQLFMGDMKFLQRSGAVLDVEVYHSGVVFAGADATMLSFRDVTLTKRMELELRQAQKLESIGRLAAGVAHEINTPVQYIGDSAYFLADALRELLGLLDTSREKLRVLHAEHGTPKSRIELELEEESIDLGFLRTQAPRAVERINDGAAKVARIVQAMSSLSQSGDEARRPLDVNRALEDTLVLAAHELKTAAAGVTTELGLLPPVQGYPSDLNQALLNVVVNAAHAIADRQGEGAPGSVHVTTKSTATHVEVTVADNGCGMSPAVQARLFEPFFTTKEVGRGTGQGLVVARAAAQKHDGTLEFESELGVGTTFVLRIPIMTGAPPA